MAQFPEHEHFKPRKMTHQDRKIMAGLAIMAGVKKIPNKPGYVNFGLFKYQKWHFLARGHTNPQEGFVDPTGYISFVHIAFTYIEIQRYVDLAVENGVDKKTLTTVQAVSDDRLVWRVFKHLHEKTAWWKWYPDLESLLCETIQIVEKSVLNYFDKPTGTIAA